MPAGINKEKDNSLAMHLKEMRERFSKAIRPHFSEREYRKLTGPEKHRIFGKDYYASRQAGAYKDYELKPEEIEKYLEKVVPPGGYSTPEEAIVELAKHFSRKFLWKTNYFGKPTVREMLADGRGNCHVKGMLLAASLKALGIPATLGSARHEGGHSRVEVHLPKVPVNVDFDANKVRVTTPSFIWEIWDNGATVRDLRGIFEGKAPEKKVSIFSTFYGGGKEKKFEELGEGDFKDEIDRVVWKKISEEV